MPQNETAKLWPIERRILAYLDQRGGSAHRAKVVSDLASPDSRIAQYQGGGSASNRGEPRIMGAWCRRLKARGWVQEVCDRGFYRSHKITAAGRAGLREASDDE